MKPEIRKCKKITLDQIFRYLIKEFNIKVGKERQNKLTEKSRTMKTHTVRSEKQTNISSVLNFFLYSASQFKALGEKNFSKPLIFILFLKRKSATSLVDNAPN